MKNPFKNMGFFYNCTVCCRGVLNSKQQLLKYCNIYRSSAQHYHQVVQGVPAFILHALSINQIYLEKKEIKDVWLRNWIYLCHFNVNFVVFFYENLYFYL